MALGDKGLGVHPVPISSGGGSGLADWLSHLAGRQDVTVLTNTAEEQTWSFTFKGSLVYRKKLKASDSDKIYSDSGFTTEVASRW